MVRQAHDKRDVVVIGLGNVLLSDEGIGVNILEHLSRLAEKYPSIDFVNSGTGGLNILHLLEHRSKAIIIDCANMGVEAGRIKRFTPDEVLSVKKLVHYSLHEQDLLQIIDLARRLGCCPQEIVIFGIQPENTSLGQKLSQKLVDRMDDYITFICEELDS
ncbi:MAG: hydrogenase maturation protease [Sedimentisphaerales bacterium]|nr:hydrogenase maturation protease [Sedimentisphaerales bacterium]